MMDPLPWTTSTSTSLCIKTIDVLIERGVSLDKQYGEFHDTLLHHAARFKSLDVVKYLLEKGANIEALDKFEGTPLNDAAFRGDMCIVKYLLDSGSDKKHHTRRGRTPANTAYGRGFYDLEEYIKSYEYMPTKGVHIDDGQA